jgi:hypothetical protein|tara:strand:+ start:415 stop:789 length:375 start_codon:yes stop_codon:yes gene_type:complete
MKKSSEKSFGMLFFGLFLIIGLWPLLNSAEIRVWSIMLSFAFLILAYLQPKLLKPLNRSWIKLGEILGRIVAPIIMALIFFTIVTPISLLVRVLGKDLLRLKFSKNDTYWIKRVKNITTMDKQF